MQQLSFEKVVDKIKRKYEAVVRMSVKARVLAESDLASDPEKEVKVTTVALEEYLQENHLEDLTDDSGEKKTK